LTEAGRAPAWFNGVKGNVVLKCFNPTAATAIKQRSSNYRNGKNTIVNMVPGRMAGVMHSWLVGVNKQLDDANKAFFCEISTKG
jgi:hypothetical protein